MRRCTVYQNHGWRTALYEGWLVQVYSIKNTDYAVCVDENGMMSSFPLGNVKLHVPTRVDLMDGAPRRAADTRADGPPYD